MNQFWSVVDQESKLDHFAKSMGVMALSSSLNFESVESGVCRVVGLVEEVTIGVLKLENEVLESCGLVEGKIGMFTEGVLGNEKSCGVVVSLGGERE